MMIRDAIREASSRHEIFFLLTAYVEAVGYRDERNQLPWQVRALPLAGTDDVKARVHTLYLRSCTTRPRSENDTACRIIGETLELYQTALRRLGSLEQNAATRLARAAGRHTLNNSMPSTGLLVA